MQEKKLMRSTNKVLTGVCGGLAEYTGLDPMLMRVIWVVGSFLTGGAAALVYIVLYFLMPAPDGGAATGGGGAGTS